MLTFIPCFIMVSEKGLFFIVVSFESRTLVFLAIRDCCLSAPQPALEQNNKYLSALNLHSVQWPAGGNSSVCKGSQTHRSL